MRRIISLFIVLASLSVSAQKAGEGQDEFKQFSKGHYSFSYPGNWSVDTSKIYGLELLLRSPKTDSLDDFMENMNIFVQDLKGQGYYLSKMGQESDAQIRSMVTDVEVLESRLDSSSTQNSYILKYKGRQGKFTLLFIQQYYLLDEVGYAVTFTLKAGKEAEYLPIVEKLLKSFKVK